MDGRRITVVGERDGPPPRAQSGVRALAKNLYVCAHCRECEICEGCRELDGRKDALL